MIKVRTVPKELVLKRIRLEKLAFTIIRNGFSVAVLRPFETGELPKPLAELPDALDSCIVD